MAWNVIAAFTLDKIFGYQTANKLRENAIALASRRSGRFLGGSKEFPNQMAWTLLGQPRAKIIGGLGPHNVFAYQDVEIDGTNAGGLTYRAVVEVRTNNPAISITPKIRNIDAGSDAGVGVACTFGRPDYTGTNQRQIITLTILTGVNRYRLQYTLGANGFDCDTWCSGEIEAFATA